MNTTASILETHYMTPSPSARRAAPPHSTILPPSLDKLIIEELSQGNTAVAIAEEAGVSAGTIRRRAKSLGIEFRKGRPRKTGAMKPPTLRITRSTVPASDRMAALFWLDGAAATLNLTVEDAIAKMRTAVDAYDRLDK